MKGSGRRGRKKAEQTPRMERNEVEEEQAREEEQEVEQPELEEEESDDYEDDGEEEEEQQPKLADGFYEIEDIRKKKIHKGKLQYLIKWRGWPETENTWEPVENLRSCADIIEAFEESSKSKYRKRKKRTSSQGKKKQQQQPIAPEPEQFPSLEPDHPDRAVEVGSIAESQDQVGGETNEEDQENVAIGAEANQESNNNVLMEEYPSETVITSTDVENVHDEGDHNITELNEVANGNVTDTMNSEGNGTPDGLHMGEASETAQTNPSKGAKRRKSGSIRRFKQDPASYQYDEAQNQVPTSMTEGMGKSEVPGAQHVLSNGDAGDKSNSGDTIHPSSIVKIIKPIAFSAAISNEEQDVSITFQVLRSDGSVTSVDNKYLKANNPHLLISFYEQHLRYNPL